MYLFKALYVLLYMIAAAIAVAWSLLHLWQGDWLWLAPCLLWAPLPLLNLWRFYRANLCFPDERERVVLGLGLVGLALVLVGASRGPVLWWSLAGLFSLLLFLFVVSRLNPGVREKPGDSAALPALDFLDPRGRRVKVTDLAGVSLLVVVHAHWCPYARMALRELRQQARQQGLPPTSIMLLFPDYLPDWCQPLIAEGFHCCYDEEGNSSQALGLWLRGGSSFLPGGANALRPALAALDADGKPVFWRVASNYRLPPLLGDHWQRLRPLLADRLRG
ncbi:hypothetical protein G8764_18435 [Pseudomaricurvus alcaniphilus]|uniref:hypothetical protein n=1 Tax=Pseudomaricurvus alcaniphilus TaxID=1166482 RepID=UPI00140B3C47|nr:hypothetical protein [Pseudomaricurvus alcaniphilus]NHN39288.1 hypothetical protein [Pseudomaricurvus alcaniphilus]